MSRQMWRRTAEHEALCTSIRRQREHIAACAQAVFAQLERVETLRLDHAAESVDGRLMAERMMTRLACAQANQAAELTRRLAGLGSEGEGEDDIVDPLAKLAADWQPSADDGSRGDGVGGSDRKRDEIDGGEFDTDSSDGEGEGGVNAEIGGISRCSERRRRFLFALSRLEALRAEHRSARESLRASAERERGDRERSEAAEMAAATEELNKARAELHRAQTGVAATEEPTALSASPLAESLPVASTSVAPPLPSVEEALDAVVQAAIRERAFIERAAAAERIAAAVERAKVDAAAAERRKADAREAASEHATAMAVLRAREEERTRAECERRQREAVSTREAERRRLAELELSRTRMMLAGGVLGRLSLHDLRDEEGLGGSVNE